MCSANKNAFTIFFQFVIDHWVFNFVSTSVSVHNLQNIFPKWKNLQWKKCARFTFFLKRSQILIWGSEQRETTFGCFLCAYKQSLVQVKDFYLGKTLKPNSVC